MTAPVRASAETASEACKLIAASGGGYAVEQSYPWKGSVRMFDLEAYKELLSSQARLVKFDQCMYEQVSTKPTEFLYHGGDFGKLAARCKHEGGHPSIVGCLDESGNYLTKQLGAYPPLLNIVIADTIADAVFHKHLD